MICKEIKKDFSHLFFSDNRSIVKIKKESKQSVINFCKDLERITKTAKITLIRESNKGLFFYLNEYDEKIIDVIENHEKINLKYHV